MNDFWEWLKSFFRKEQVVKPVVNATPWMQVVDSQMGVKEITGLQANPDIVKYHKTTGGWSSDEVAWCASFVSWVMIECGFHKKGDRGVNWALAISWLMWGVPCDLKYGAVVVVKTSIGHHVTFCQAIEGDNFIGRGGNQSNAVKDVVFKKSQIVGCRWPA